MAEVSDIDVKLNDLFLCYGTLTHKQIAYHKSTNNYSISKCPICGNVLKWKNGKYQIYCSKECQYIYFKSDQYKTDFKSISLKKFKVDNPMKNEMVQISQQISTYSKYLTKNYTSSSEYKNKIEVLRKQMLVDDGYVERGYKYIEYCGNGRHKYYCPKCDEQFTTNLYNKRKKRSEICTNCNPVSYYKHKNNE